MEIGAERGLQNNCGQPHVVCMVPIIVLSSADDLQDSVLSVSRSAFGINKREYDEGTHP